MGETTPIADEILAGKANLDDITNDEVNKKLLEIFKTSTPELKIEITKEKMMDQYKKWN